jgi:hypothetical protein
MHIKNNITFTVMKGIKKLLIRSFFLLAVSLYLGINSYSYFNLRHITNEIITCTSNVEYSFSSNTDTLNDDQIDKSDNPDFSPEPCSLYPPRRIYLPVHILCFSIWQPPKIS